MLLQDREGSELELSIAGYRFPRSQIDPWDSNALLVAVRVVAPEGMWEVVDPCLTTWEAGHLVRWLTVAAHLPPGLAPLPFNQPNITITARPGEAASRLQLRVCFELELRPPWGRTTGAGNLCVDLDVERGQLAAAALSLDDDVARFPQRGDDPSV